jgi:hypothetical protein
MIAGTIGCSVLWVRGSVLWALGSVLKRGGKEKIEDKTKDGFKCAGVVTWAIRKIKKKIILA